MIPIDPRCTSMLQAALELPAAERPHFVERECGGDTALLARMRALLALDGEQWDLLDQPVDAIAAGLLDRRPPVDRGADHHAGQLIGPYRMVRELGRGGMGSVWLAERADGQFEQRVALKLIKLGMDSAHVQTQFRRERAMLARLQHPNIAQLIDGGVDDRGRPWFAMELIDGIGLAAWIEQRQPGLRQRLQLFVTLCRAVAHAHRQLIVHRDLKPSNVLVQANDQPRLLDFGIAKLIEDDSTEETATQHRFLTRDFAAPEQIRGEMVTTATDVYALGLLLFELLTGSRYRTLCKDDDPTLRPSAALALTASAPTGTTAPGIVRAHLRGDLDAITLRALAADAARRYPAAQALADDVQRHLDGKPVDARPDGMRYRTAKFMRRHRAAVAVAAIGLAALLTASGVALWQAHAKAQEAGHARIALKRSEAIRGFIESVFLSADPMHTKGVDTTAGELLQAARGKVAHELGDEPAVAASVLDQIGNTYVSLGDDKAAREILREALAFNARAAQPSLQVEGSAAARLAHYDYMDGHTEAALAELDRIIKKLRNRGSGVEQVLAKALQLQGNVLFNSGQPDAAVAASAEAVAVLRPHAREFASEYINAQAVYADAAAANNQGAQALQATDQALAQPLLQGDDAPALKIMVLGAKVRALQVLQRNAEAEPLLAKVVAGHTHLFGADSSRTRYWRYRHAQLLQALGRLDAAQDAIDALIDVPPDDTEQPIAHVAHVVAAATIARARRSPDAADRAAVAEALACAGDGSAGFCEKARALRASPQ